MHRYRLNVSLITLSSQMDLTPGVSDTHHIEDAKERKRGAGVGAYGEEYGLGWESSDDEVDVDADASFAIYDSLGCGCWRSAAVRCRLLELSSGALSAVGAQQWCVVGCWSPAAVRCRQLELSSGALSATLPL